MVGTRNYILHESARHHYGHGVGALSIKTFTHGRAQYKTGTGYHAIDASSYMILNEGQPYTIEIDAEVPVESFCIFFQSGLAEEVYNSRVCTSHQLLDNPTASSILPLHFFERTYHHDQILSPALQCLKTAYPYHHDDAGWLTEQMHDLVQRLLQVHGSFSTLFHRHTGLSPREYRLQNR